MSDDIHGRTPPPLGRLAPVALGLSALLSAAGCYQTLRIDDPDGSPPPWADASGPTAPPDRDGGAPRDAPPGTFTPPPGKCVESSAVDLLFVIDDSNSMSEEQANLVRALPQLIDELVAPPDRDGDGRLDWLPVTDLHVGVVTTDMGTGGFELPTCERSDFGDDGLLRTEGRGDGGCLASYPPFLTYAAGVTSAAELAQDVGCVLHAGTGGCGFEQPLEAALKASSPSSSADGYEPPRFFRNTLGHGDRHNRGFVRADSLLAAVLVTDEDDCSARDPELFDPTSPTYVADLNLRCSMYATEALHPISRYAEGLVALRRRRPDLLAFAVLAGIPADLARIDPSDADYDRILDDPRMQERPEPGTAQLVPSCDDPARGSARPPRRLVQVARELGPGRSTVQSICADDLSDAAHAIARRFGTRACERFTE